MNHGLHLGKIGGVEVILDWSLLIIFVLITFGLGSGLFPQWHSDWSPLLVWGTAIVAAVSFIAAVLVHELSHAWVGRSRGVEINRITLFVFGGMAQMEGEPRRWQDEFWMAIVGPVTSALIGFVCILLGSFLSGDVELQAADIEESIRALGPVPTLLFWLGPVNIILALFNLVPGFPLDGGRVLRAGVWGLFGDLRRATRWASNAGRAFAALLILSGFAMILGYSVPVFGTGLVGGLWLALIGWFLNNAAIMSYRQQVLRDTLGDVTVEQIMQKEITTIAADLSLSELVEEYLLRSEQRVLPVVDGGELVGLVTVDAIRSAARDRWGTTRVSEIMMPAGELTTLQAGDAAIEAMSLLNRGGPGEVPVVARGSNRLLGLLTRENLLKWLAIHGEAIGRTSLGPGAAGPGR